jgi:acetoin utilization protein AcuB
VKDVMTACPHSIGRDQPLESARSMMQSFGIRHMPVLAGGKLEGVLTERDIALVNALGQVDFAGVPVEEAMTRDVFTVSPETSLAEVATEMATHRYGSTVVVDHGKVVGIVTTTDICRALAEALEQPRHP